jgi:hypothetical protein
MRCFIFLKSAARSRTDNPEPRVESPVKDALIGLLCALPLWGLLVYGALRFEMDDSLIYARYLRNFIQHGEMTFNLGHRWLGLTSPLFTCLTLGIAYMTGKIIPAINLFSGILLLGASLGLQYLFARLTGRRLAGFFALALVICSPFFYYCFGLETTLVMLLTVVALILYLHEAYKALSFVLGILLITRIDTGLFLVAVLLELLRQKGWPWIRGKAVLLVPILAPIVAVSVFHRICYVNSSLYTAMAKVGQGLSGYWGTWPLSFIDVRWHKGLFWGTHIWLCVPMALLAIAGAFLVRGRRLSRLIITYLVLYGGVFTLFNSPNYHWYYAPFYLFGLGYAGIALAELIRRSLSISNQVRRMTAGALSIALAAMFMVSTALLAYRSTSTFGPNEGYLSTAVFIEENCHAGATVATVEIGAIGWYCPDREIIDILGLVTEGNAEAIARKDVVSWLYRNNPDCILVHDPLWVFEQVVTEAESIGLYQEFPGFEVNGLRLLRRVNL